MLKVNTMVVNDWARQINKISAALVMAQLFMIFLFYHQMGYNCFDVQLLITCIGVIVKSRVSRDRPYPDICYNHIMTITQFVDPSQSYIN